MEGTLVTGNFFDVLDVRAALGRTFSAADDQRGGTPVLVISHRTWTTHFDSDPGVLGRIVRVNETPVRLSGIMPEGFRGLMVASLDFWAPLAHADRFLPGGAADPSSVELGIIGRLALTVSGRFSVLSYLVAQRTREIGVRMPLGATRRSTIGLYVLGQSARPVLVGLVFGGGLAAVLGAMLLATPAAEAIGTTIDLFDPVAYAAGLTTIVAACLRAAIVPALRATRVEPIRALRQD